MSEASSPHLLAYEVVIWPNRSRLLKKQWEVRSS